MTLPAIELSRLGVAVALDIAAMPECERVAFAEAIADRAAAWRVGTPAQWPIVVRVEQDPRVRAERY